MNAETAIPKPAPGLPVVVDKEAALALVDAIIGWEPVGVVDNEEISRLKAPEARGHLCAVLGKQMPSSAWQMRRNADQARALASYLRSVADAIDQPLTTTTTVAGAVK